MDILELALNDKHMDMVIFLLRENPQLMEHILSNGVTCKQRLMALNKYEYVKVYTKS